MKKKIFLFAALLALTVSGVAKADYEGLYWGAFGGANWVNVKSSHGHGGSGSGSNNFSNRGSIDFKTGWLAGASVGYQWCNGFSGEVEFAYRHNQIDKWKLHGFSDSSSDFVTADTSSDSSFRNHSNHGSLRTWSVLANGIYEFQLDCWCIKPYVGAGIGYANSKLKTGHIVFSDSSSSSSSETRFSGSDDRKGFAWQVIAGIAYPICDNFDLDIEYRYFQTRGGSHSGNVSNNSVDVGIKYLF